MAETRKLFEDFPPVTRQEWMDKIIADLKGADFNKKLVWRPAEGFEVWPFYMKEDLDGVPLNDVAPGEYPWVRGGRRSGNDWLVRQEIMVNDYTGANRKAKWLTERGVNSFGFVLCNPQSVSHDNIATLINGIDPERVEINFVPEGRAIELAESLIRISAERGMHPSAFNGAIETDPLGRLMINGRLCIPLNEGLDYLASLFRAASPLGKLRLVKVNASLFSDAGSDTVQELAFGLSMGNEYVAALASRGISIDTAFSRIKFGFGTGSNYFFEIAKLRAARMLWSVIAGKWETQDKDSARMCIHSRTTRWNKTLFDPWVNMLRTQTEAMSAVLGGADSLTVEPFDTVFREPQEFSERIARNQQLLLKEEAYFSKVADPGGGSYYIGQLTGKLAESAWKLFVETENRGGFLSALKDGFIQQKIKETASARRKNIAASREVLTGTTRYPLPEEGIPDGFSAARAFPEHPVQADTEVEPLITARGAEEIEKLRIAALNSERKPVIFLLPAGNPVMAMARSQFSSNFFACGGYNITVNPLFETVGEGVKKAVAAKASVIVLCSSDDDYPSLATELVQAAPSGTILVIAGNPPSAEELKKLGIKYFISIRSDLAETIRMFHKLTGVTD
ncbi:MAG TPA: methylmalonyl-CoA mutase family protein [Bacteroidales bacterium]|nr:methylmalonyl-CoA mutase family protein [Bacteroidales bacterium]